MAYMDKERATSRECAAKSEGFRKQMAGEFKERETAHRALMKDQAAVFNERHKAYLAKHAEYEKPLGKC